MSLDTKYRPNKYKEVLGQESTVQILRGYVKRGAGFHQSYLFAGPWGSGKTTLGRILARSLLCLSPVEGEPCDTCVSCRSILEGGTSENFIEIDAATNSGKDSIRKIVDEIAYSTFSGRQRIYLFDESHRLSTDALDALLKPMEDNVPGSEDKSLICIFCTTEPERMRATILSRCAPAFVIRPIRPVQVGARLAEVCEAEGLSYDREALDLIGELTECHIRDALKAVEGVANLGAIDRTNVASYLHLDSHVSVLEILSSILTDLPKALQKASELLKTTNPTTVYERLAKSAMMAYQAGLGIASVPSFLDAKVVQEIGSGVGTRLLSYANRFSSRPGHPSDAMLLCDIAQLHQEAVAPQIVYATLPSEVSAPKPTESGTVKTEGQPKMVDDVYVHPRAVKSQNDQPTSSPPASPRTLAPLEFFKLVRVRVNELETEKRNGRTGQDNVGGLGANQGGGAESH